MVYRLLVAMFLGHYEPRLACKGEAGDKQTSLCLVLHCYSKGTENFLVPYHEGNISQGYINPSVRPSQMCHSFASHVDESSPLKGHLDMKTLQASLHFSFPLPKAITTLRRYHSTLVELPWDNGVVPPPKTEGTLSQSFTRLHEMKRRRLLIPVDIDA